MNPQSLVIIFSNSPQIRTQNFLLDDYTLTEIENVRVFADVAPWNAMHDLLVDQKTQKFAGIVYPVSKYEQVDVAALCQRLPSEVIRYCISLNQAADALNNPHFSLPEMLTASDSQNSNLKKFPKILRPFRQAIRSCLLGESNLDELPEEIRNTAAQYFEEAGITEWTKDTARVEITWMKNNDGAKFPTYFPSFFNIEAAEYFAEDIWFYREDTGEIFAVGINHVDKTLENYGLQLPEDF